MNVRRTLLSRTLACFLLIVGLRGPIAAWADESPGAVVSAQDLAPVAQVAEQQDFALTTAAEDGPLTEQHWVDGTQPSAGEGASVSEDRAGDASTASDEGDPSESVDASGGGDEQLDSAAPGAQMDDATIPADKPDTAQKVGEPTQNEQVRSAALVESAAKGIVGKVYSLASTEDPSYAAGISKSSTTPLASAALQKADDSLAVRWLFKDAGDGFVTIKNVNSGMVLDVASAKAEKGATIWQRDEDGSIAQKWLPVEVESGCYAFISALTTALVDASKWYVLDVSGRQMIVEQRIQLWSYNGTTAQRWSLVPDASDRALSAADMNAFAAEHRGTLKNGSQVVLAPKSGGFLVLDVKGGSTADKANVQGYISNASDAQTWTVRTDSAGFVTLVNRKSGKVLDVAGGKAANGTNVWQYGSNASPAQKWVASKNTNGSITLWSALGHAFVLDLARGGKTNGTNVQIYQSNGSAAQQLVVVERQVWASAGKTIADGYYTISLSGTQSVADIRGGSRSDGAVAQVYTTNGSTAQVFHVTYGSDGYYRLRSIHSHRDLSVGSNLLAGAPVRQETISASSSGQRWIIRSSGDSYQIVSALSGNALASSSATKSTALVASNTASLRQWSLKATSPAVATGVYTITSALDYSSVLDVTGASKDNGALLQIYTPNGSMAQRFYLARQSDGTYTIESLSSTKHLSAITSGKVTQQTPSGTDTNQRWIIKYTPYGLGLVSVKTGKAISLSSAARSTKASQVAGTAAGQSFFLASARSFGYGAYVISSALNGSYCLDVVGGSVSNGANVQLYTKNGTRAQKWLVADAGSGYVTITNVKSGLALDVAGGKTANGTNVRQYQVNAASSNNAQRWLITYTGGGAYAITSALSNSAAVDVTGAKAAKGTNVQIYHANGTKAQRWVLEPTKTGILIALDPGHGGNDSGAVGNGLRERDLTWSITQACAAQLRSYGYDVFLTVGESEFKNTGKAAVSIKDRVDRAAAKGASCVISMHVNAGGGSGAELLVPNASSYHRELYTQGQKFASILLPKLNKLGLPTRGDGTYERNYSTADGAEKNLYYSGGGYQDYYGIVRYARLKGMLGVIIEHGFIDNAYDAAILRQATALQKIGKADADALRELLG